MLAQQLAGNASQPAGGGLQKGQAAHGHPPALLGLAWIEGENHLQP